MLTGKVSDNMPMKCIAQMPQPMAAAPATSQRLMAALDCALFMVCEMLTAEKAASDATKNDNNIRIGS